MFAEFETPKLKPNEQELSANSKIDKDTEKAYVTGAMDERQVCFFITLEPRVELHTSL